LAQKLEHEICNNLESEVTADRWTRLDREIRMAADEVGAIDLRPEASGIPDPDINRLMRGRLRYLERLGLATSAGPGEWTVGLEAERKIDGVDGRAHHVRFPGIFIPAIPYGRIRNKVWLTAVSERPRAMTCALTTVAQMSRAVQAPAAEESPTNAAIAMTESRRVKSKPISAKLMP
jgi:hypothetical protein